MTATAMPPSTPMPSKARWFFAPIGAYLGVTLLGLVLLKTMGHAFAVRIAIALLFGVSSIVTALVVKSAVFTRPLLLGVAFIMTVAGVVVAALASTGGDVFNAGWLIWMYVWLLAVSPASGSRWCRSAAPLALGVAVVLGAILVGAQLFGSRA
jgi:hypothetical protein